MKIKFYEDLKFNYVCLNLYTYIYMIRLWVFYNFFLYSFLYQKMKMIT